jgi:hypothetical protein
MTSGTESEARRKAARVAAGDLCAEQDCTKPRRKRNLCSTHYNRRYGHSENSERDKARQRAKTHKRKAIGRHTDITLEYEQHLRRKTRRCPLCRVHMTIRPYVPTSKELDHIVPLNIGGTHTIGNVRIICRTCNLARPKDGSDYLGPVTLWAQVTGFVARPPTPRHLPPPTCECGAVKRKGRCWTCRPIRVRPRAEDGKRAAQLRADGMLWTEIARTVGFNNTGACYLAAKAHGDPDVVARWPEPYAGWRGPRPAVTERIDQGPACM